MFTNLIYKSCCKHDLYATGMAIMLLKDNFSSRFILHPFINIRNFIISLFIAMQSIIQTIKISCMYAFVSRLVVYWSRVRLESLTWHLGVFAGFP